MTAAGQGGTDMLIGNALTEQDKCELKDIFDNFDEISILIKESIFNESWSDYEEAGGIFIFRGIDDCLYHQNWGSGWYCKTNNIEFSEISEAEALDEIKNWNNS